RHASNLQQLSENVEIVPALVLGVKRMNLEVVTGNKGGWGAKKIVNDSEKAAGSGSSRGQKVVTPSQPQAEVAKDSGHWGSKESWKTQPDSLCRFSFWILGLSQMPQVVSHVVVANAVVKVKDSSGYILANIKFVCVCSWTMEPFAYSARELLCIFCKSPANKMRRVTKLMASVQTMKQLALMKHAPDAMKESRVHDFLASWGKPSRANEGRRREGGKSSCYH
ncbi:hypothetical protein Tco_0869511, partial [Tanacetum coccineum]